MSSVVNIVKRADVAVFSFFNCKIHGRKLSAFMSMVTELGSLVFSILASMVLIVQPHKAIRLIGITMAISLLLSQMVVQSLKRIVNRERPYKALEKSNPVKPTKCAYSFPSGHTSSAFCIALVLSYFIPVLSVIFFAFAFLVGLSRIYLGCHYPTDVLIGGVISFVSFSMISEFVVPVLQRIIL